MTRAPPRAKRRWRWCARSPSRTWQAVEAGPCRGGAARQRGEVPHRAGDRHGPRDLFRYGRNTDRRQRRVSANGSATAGRILEAGQSHLAGLIPSGWMQDSPERAFAELREMRQTTSLREGSKFPKRRPLAGWPCLPQRLFPTARALNSARHHRTESTPRSVCARDAAAQRGANNAPFPIFDHG